MNFKKTFTLCGLLVMMNTTIWAARFDLFFPHLMKAEGLYFVIIQYDKGGATKFGITLYTYLMWCNQTKVVWIGCDKDKNGVLNANDLRVTTLNDVRPIYQKQYWDTYHLSEVDNQAIAEITSDLIVNCGPGVKNKHIKAIQTYLKLKPDGVMGTKTIEKINKTNANRLYHFIYQYREKHYLKIGVGKQKKFLKGWLNRISTLKQIHKHENYINL
ncbi:glycosyl hydrolase 108 family protein [Arcicella aquatica]|uniref:Glycosyl hydrolase 108 family protein n=1 Tax=Arcicella aquatica TaxID=217141 RepID=A0ABU5QRL3_9BACT|nr:glycosyl hydrolase 108 family protein [Arcicella aquatica]MEA5259469.1 glycosyl hydrolase 108 family protein [Arcicella aquatica]